MDTGNDATVFSGMFWKWKKETRRKLFLGSVTVASSPSLKKGISSSWTPDDNDVKELIQQSLLEILALPPLSQRDPDNGDDLAIDLTVSDYELGSFTYLGAGHYVVPLVWRPEIIMTARVYEPANDKTICAHTVRYRPSWKQWIRMNLSIRELIKTRGKLNPRDRSPDVDAERIKRFVLQSCVNLLTKVQRDF